MTFSMNIKTKDRIPVLCNNDKNTSYNGQQRRIPVTGENIRNTDHNAQYKNTTYREH